LNLLIKILSLPGYFLTAVFLAGTQLQVIHSAFSSNFGNQVAAAQGVVQGLPHWRIYQSRILGPFFIETLSKLFNLSFGKAYVLGILVLLVLFFGLILIMAKQYWKSTAIALGIATGAWTLLAVIMQGFWIYPWDFFDLIIFTLLVWAILHSKPLWIISAIIALEIPNREVALVICVWLIIDAFFNLKKSEYGLRGLSIKFEPFQLFIALILLGLGYGLIEFLRSSLLIREVGPEIFPDLKAGAQSFQFQLLTNLEEMMFFLTHPFYKYSVFNVIIFGIPALIIVSILSQSREVVRLSFLYLIIWFLNFIFGLIYETRVWICFIPYLVFVFPIVLTKQRTKK